MRNRKPIVGYDLSTDTWHLAVICRHCVTVDEKYAGEPLYQDDPWGDPTGDSFCCVRCGMALPLNVMEP